MVLHFPEPPWLWHNVSHDLLHFSCGILCTTLPIMLGLSHKQLSHHGLIEIDGILNDEKRKYGG